MVEQNEEDTKTRAVFLRERYLHEDGWRSTSQEWIGRNRPPEILMGDVVEQQARVVEASKLADIADKAFETARTAKIHCDSELDILKVDLDILKMALIDALEIPE